MKKYYQLVQADRTADVTIYGDITSLPLGESEVSSYNLSREIAGLDVDVINVYINSYGGEVAEGLAIYNELKRHKAKVKTYCDGFACSAASVVFIAGDERIMSAASLLMIHNAWTCTDGNAEVLRKAADDLETITQASVNAYLACVSIGEDILKSLMAAETWLLPSEALDMGFATAIVNEPKTAAASQSVRKTVFAKLTARPEEKPKEANLSEEIKPEEKNLSTFLNALAKRGKD